MFNNRTSEHLFGLLLTTPVTCAYTEDCEPNVLYLLKSNSEIILTENEYIDGKQQGGTFTVDATSNPSLS